MQSKTIKWGILFLVATVVALLVAGLIDWVFVAGHRRVGSAASNSLAREYMKHPGVVALALEARCRTGEYPEAQKLIQEIGTTVRSAVLRQAIAHCEQDFTFARAEHLLQQGLAPGAIRLMSPWYPTGPDPYRAGVILMRANLVEHHFNRALKLGSALSARYPGDPTLARLIHELKARVTLDRAQAALASGHAGEAIRLAALPERTEGPDGAPGLVGRELRPRRGQGLLGTQVDERRGERSVLGIAFFQCVIHAGCTVEPVLTRVSPGQDELCPVGPRAGRVEGA